MIVPPGQLPSGDHPLNANPESAWGAYFKDNEVLLQIDKDVRRLCPDISFFQQVCVVLLLYCTVYSKKQYNLNLSLLYFYGS